MIHGRSKRQSAVVLFLIFSIKQSLALKIGVGSVTVSQGVSESVGISEYERVPQTIDDVNVDIHYYPRFTCLSSI